MRACASTRPAWRALHPKRWPGTPRRPARAARKRHNNADLRARDRSNPGASDRALRSRPCLPVILSIMAIHSRRALAAAAFALVIAYLAWAASPAPGTGYYDLLARGFANGHLYTAVDPVPELLALSDPYDPIANAPYRVHDMSLYRGRYYLYFGPVPALTLFLPWGLITGKPLGDGRAALICVIAGYVFSLLLLRALLHARNIRPGVWLTAGAILFLGLG